VRRVAMVTAAPGATAAAPAGPRVVADVEAPRRGPRASWPGPSSRCRRPR
jgi:hypothetical protein